MTLEEVRFLFHAFHYWEYLRWRDFDYGLPRGDEQAAAEQLEAFCRGIA